MQEVREHKKLTRSELARRLKTTRIQVWRWETGTTQIPADLVPDVADALEITVAALYREARVA